MHDNTDEKLTAKMATILLKKTVDTKTVGEALEFICGNFSFAGGLIYDLDQSNRFNLRERRTPAGAQLRENFFSDDISGEYRACLAEEAVTFIDGAVSSSQAEKKLLEIFHAGSLALMSVLDENMRICGFIVFFNTMPGVALAAPRLHTLSRLLFMFGRYIGIRIYQNKLTFAQVSLESILDNTGIDIYVNDFYTHEVLYVNKSMAAPYGGAAQFASKKCWQVLFPGQTGPCEFCPQTKLIDESGKPTKVYSWDYQRPFDGSWFRVFSAAFRWKNGRLAHVVSSADITENKKNEELIKYLASYDPLTGLPNRRKLIDDCEKLIHPAGGKSMGYLLFFDIDGFKSINDNFGHDAGDDFLIKLGDFFSSIPLLKNVVYRNGGDEFIAVLNQDITKENVRNLAYFIGERFKKDWVLKTGAVMCSVSIGAAHYPEDGTTAEGLIHKADQAMYRIKKAGGRDICFAGQN